MTGAAIFIPSNRTLEHSIEPIWSAISYAQQRGMRVVISDNSGETAKRDYFSAAPSHVTYLGDGPSVGPENALRAIEAADADFVLMLGDDDRIGSDDSHPVFDFSTVPADVVGIKPRIDLVNSGGEVSHSNIFTIDETDPAVRVIEYTRKMAGGNSTFYSFFRRDTFQGLLDILANQHPTRAGNVDFAIVYALIAEGRVVHDPSTVLRYDNSHWENDATAEKSMQGIFSLAGLPADAQQYMLLFHFLDAYVLMFRSSSALAPIERYKSGYAVGMVFLKRLLFRIGETPFLYGNVADLVEPLRHAVESTDPDLDQIFHIAGLMADRVKPGLKQEYDRFLVTVARSG